MTYVLPFIFVFFKAVSVLFFVFSSVCSDVGDISTLYLNPQPAGYVYPQPPILLEEPTPQLPIYLPPLPPIFADEIPAPPPPNYLPPNSFPVYLPPPSNEIFPPQEAQLPAVIANDDSVVVPAVPPQNTGLYPPSHALLTPQVKIENMSCIQGLNFKATFKMASDLPQFPVVDDATEGCITPLSGNVFKIDLMSFNNMLKCGVRRCKSSVPQVTSNSMNLGGRSNTFRGTVQGGENMCVGIRMPTVRGVRLPEDAMVTIMCIPQERVVSQTRHIRLGTNKIVQNSRGRSTNSFIATGGTHKDFRSKISIFRRRPGTNTFDQNVQPESVIQLGEELVLRAVIDDGDGWANSQLGPVLITGLNSKKSALLVNQNGCVNPVMRSICPHHPVKTNPLSIELHFRAFLFQESPQGDEMVVSVKMQACLHIQDCVKTDHCKDDPSTVRSKRDLTKSNKTYRQNDGMEENNFLKEVKDWESQLSFRVQPYSTKRNTLKFTNSTEQENLFLLYAFLTGIIFLSVFIVIILLGWQLCHRKRKF